MLVVSIYTRQIRRIGIIDLVEIGAQVHIVRVCIIPRCPAKVRAVRWHISGSTNRDRIHGLKIENDVEHVIWVYGLALELPAVQCSDLIGS